MSRLVFDHHAKRHTFTFELVRTRGNQWSVSVFYYGSPACTLGPYDGDLTPAQVLLNVATQLVLEQNDTGNLNVGGR